MTDDARDDGWGTTDEYDVASFYTAGSDYHGHSENLRVRVKPQLAGEIAALVASGVIPDYGTPAALIRDAIVHRLHWLSEHADDQVLAARLAEHIRRATIEETTSNYVRTIDSFEEFVGRARDVCDRALRFDDLDGIARYMTDVDEFAVNSREPYSSLLRKVAGHYRDELRKRGWDDGVEQPVDGEHVDGEYREAPVAEVAA